MTFAQGFQPHRIHPRYGPLFAAASRAERGVPALVAILGRFLMDTQAMRSWEVHEAQGQLAVCGFPRTGTTYFMHACELALGHRTTSVKSHDALAIGRFQRRGIATVITLREPAATVASWSLYHRDEPSIHTLRWRLATYTAWHRVALRAVERFQLAVMPFSQFTSDTQAAVQTVLAQTGLTGTPAVADYAAAATLLDADTDQAGLSWEHRNLPSKTRSRRSLAYVELLNGAELAAPLNRAYEITLALWQQSEARQPVAVS